MMPIIYYPKQKIASRLLAEIEDYAISRGCLHAHVDTFSFQAKPFYEKQGYQCQLTLGNYPVTTAMHILTKQLK